MQYKFNAYGHPNILATHKTTLEFTKDNGISLKGNCIVGVQAEFDLKKMKEFIKNIKSNEITITIEVLNNKKIKDIITAEPNIAFNSHKEFVIRKTDFVSERTFAIKADKAAFDLKRDLIRFLKEKKNKIRISIENKE